MTAPPPPPIHLEQLALGEAPAPRRAALDAYAQTPEGAARLSALADDDAATLTAHPPRLMAAAIAQRLSARQAAARRAAALRWGAATAAACAACAAALILGWPAPSPAPAPTPADATSTAVAAVIDPAPTRDPNPEGSEVIRLKGLTPRLLIHRKADPDPLPDAAPVSAGDTLQVRYVAADATHGVILSVDGRRAVTLHFPTDVRASTALGAGGAVALPHAYQLDDAPAFERFLFITSPRPLSVPDLLAAANVLARSPDAATAPLPLPDAAARQHSVLLLKHR